MIVRIPIYMWYGLGHGHVSRFAEFRTPALNRIFLAAQVQEFRINYFKLLLSVEKKSKFCVRLELEEYAVDHRPLHENDLREPFGWVNDSHFNCIGQIAQFHF